MKKRILSMLLVIVMVLSMAPVSALAAGSPVITSDGTLPYTVKKGESINLTLSGVELGQGETVTWECSNIATPVADTTDSRKCVVTGQNVGKTTVVAKVGDVKKAEYWLGVYEDAAGNPTIDGSNFSLLVSGTKTLTYTKPAGTYGVELTRWKSSKPEIATVGLTDGVVTAKSVGSTDISVFFNGKWSNPVKCTVISTAGVINVTGSADSMYVGEKLTLNTKIGETATDATASVDTAGIVDVKKTATGAWEVEGKAAGTAKITFTTTDENGVTYTSSPYTVTVNALKTMSIQRESAVDAKVGNTVPLFVQEGSTKLTGDIEWFSSAPAVAEVTSDGKMTCKTAGDVTITAKLKGYGDATRKFTVADNTLQIYMANGQPVTWINEGAEIQLMVKDTAGNELAVKEWKSSNEAAATVDTNGKLKAISRSASTTVDITAVVEGFAEPAKLTVNINCFNIVVPDVELYVGQSLTLEPKINGAVDTGVTVEVDTTVTNTGSVEPISAGSQTITGKTAGKVTLKLTKGNYSGTCTVTVKKNPLTIKDEKNATSFYVGKTYHLKAYDAANTEVIISNWQSSDPTFVEIDSDGKMTVLVAGVGKTIKVTATPNDAVTYAEATLDVAVLANSLEITAANGEPVKELYVDEFVDLVARDGNGEKVNDVIWSSSMPGVAEIGRTTGRLKGIRADEITITASKEGYTDGTAKINVALKPITIKKGEQVAEDQYELKANDKLELKAVDKETGKPVVVDWASSDSKTVTVNSEGLVTAVKSTRGETVQITASLHGYETKTVGVKVVPESIIHTIKLEGEDRPTELNVGETRKLVALDPDGVEITDVTWTLANENAVMVEAGLQGKKQGQVSIHAVSATHGTKDVTITVKFVDVTAIEIGELPAADDDGYIPMNIGDELPLTISKVEPANASDKTAIDWFSSDDTVAEVEDGKIIAHKQGYATLTAYARQMNAQQRAVREPLYEVKVHVLGEERIVLDETMPGEVLAGKALDLKASVVYANGDPVPNTRVKWTLISEEEGVILSRTDKKDVLETDSNMKYRHEIWLRAEAVRTGAEPIEAEPIDAEPIEVMVTVIPVTTGITLMVGEKKVNNQTYVVDLSDGTLVDKGIVVTASILPKSATKKVRWEITDPSNVCKELQGDTDINLTPVSTLKSGIVTVTAYAGDGTGEKATAKIQFSRLGAGKLKDVPRDLRGGASLDLSKYLVRDENADDKTVTWSIAGNVLKNGKKIASISKSGKLTTKPVTQDQDIEVIVKGSSGVSDTVTITLHPATKSIKITCDELKILNNKVELAKDKDDRQFQLDWTVKPEELESVWPVVWSSTNESIAKVDENGLLTVKKPGKVRIDCTTTDGSRIRGSLYLEVTSTVNTVTVTPDGRSLKYGDSLDMKAVIKTPYDRKAADQRVIWSIADEYGDSVDYAATISATGRVTAKDVDQNTMVVVTATSVANKEIYGSATVTIKPNTNKTLHAFIGDDMITGTYPMNKGDSCVLDAKWQKSGSGDLKDAVDCQFYSSNPAVATVDVDTGTLEAMGFGVSTITLRCVDPVTKNEYTSTFTVKVMKVNTVTINAPERKILRSGQSVQLSAIAWADLAGGVWADNQSFTWEVTENGKQTTAATIGANGVLTAGSVDKRHDVVVKAISKENSVYAEVVYSIIPANEVSLKFLFNGQEYSNILPVNLNEGISGLMVMAHISIVDQYGNISDYDTPASVTWNTENKNVVDVVYNVLYAKAVGSARLNAKCDVIGRTYWTSITAQVNRPVGSITIEQPGILVAGRSINMRVKAGNPDATNKNVIWSVDDVEDAEESVLKLVSINRYTGKLSAKRSVTKQIQIKVTAVAVDGSAQAVEYVTIYPLTTKVWILDEDGKKINGETIPVALDDTVTFEATADPDGAYDEDFQWTSSNKNVVEVDEDGNLLLKRTGAVTIKATALDGSGKYAKFKLRITK